MVSYAPGDLVWVYTPVRKVLDESRSFFRVHTGYFSNIPKLSPGEGTRLISDIPINVSVGTDFAQLKAVLSKASPSIQNRKDLEIRFYASQQRRYQESTNFDYYLLKFNKKLEPGMSEKALVDHIFIRFKPQVQGYVEVRNPQSTVQ
ncbi:uncharacterized protein TNCV_748741 [Trichonephila clavipes]|nr:uncharacterized protein TNCV_748741 [Trichonephila clavipes]